MAGSIWLWIGFWGMAAGFVALWVVGRNGGVRTTDTSAIHTYVPGVAAVFYLLMALGQGAVPLEHNSRLFYFARYIDWSITTPLLLIGLGFTALGTLKGKVTLIAAAVGADLMMIVTGFFSGASDSGSFAKWAWYVLSCGAFAAVLYVLWVPLLKLARERSVQGGATYVRHAAILSVLWLAYPVVFLGGSEGLGVLGPALVLAAFAILDLLAKVAYGLLAAVDDRAEAAAI